jgi:hypothetical protein
MNLLDHVRYSLTTQWEFRPVVVGSLKCYKLVSKYLFKYGKEEGDVQTQNKKDMKHGLLSQYLSN